MKQAKDLIQGAKGICKKGGPLLHKFVSNERSERAIDVVLDRPSKELSIERVRDQWFNNCFSATLKDHLLTKERAISTVASVYDPLGFLSPLVLKIKKILQEICKRGSPA